MEKENKKKSLINKVDWLDVNHPNRYVYYDFPVPEDVSKLSVTLHYETPSQNDCKEMVELFLTLFDPKGFRGYRLDPQAEGAVNLSLWVTSTSASEGALKGEITPGLWLIQIEKNILTASINIHVEADCEFGTIRKENEKEYPSDHVVNPNCGWYRGELHAHSSESDGKYPVETVVNAAIEYGLDYLSLTDHVTCSQWQKMAHLQNKKTALIRSLEITSSIGHANLQGITDWVNVFIDQDDWSSNQALEDTHRQGGLFCVNHAFNGVLGWHDHSINWAKVDLEEIYHSKAQKNNAYQVMLWDKHLSEGYRIVGVGGTDSHDPFSGIHEFGQVVTYIYADELSERGIIEGLRRGIVYVSRGPELRFSILNELGDCAKMWETSFFEKEVSLSVKVKWDQPLNLFIIKNGLLLDVLHVVPKAHDWESIVYTDSHPIDNSYYRVEFHDDVGVFHQSGKIWRDHTTMRLMSNPIWVRSQQVVFI